MLRRVVACVTAVAVAVGAQGGAKDPEQERLWQVTEGEWNSGATPTPPNAMYVVLGEHSFAGDTGCGPVTGALRTAKDGASVTVSRVRTPKEPTCEGAALFYHQEFIRFFTGMLRVERDGNELTLRNETDESIHLVY